VGNGKCLIRGIFTVYTVDMMLLGQLN